MEVTRDPEACSTAKPFAVKDPDGKVMSCHMTQAEADRRMAETKQPTMNEMIRRGSQR